MFPTPASFQPRYQKGAPDFGLNAVAADQGTLAAVLPHHLLLIPGGSQQAGDDPLQVHHHVCLGMTEHPVEQLGSFNPTFYGPIFQVVSDAWVDPVLDPGNQSTTTEAWPQNVVCSVHVRTGNTEILLDDTKEAW